MNITQTVKEGQVTGRNGTFELREVRVENILTGSKTDTEVAFFCIGKSGKVLRAGFAMDEISAKELVQKLADEFYPPQKGKEKPVEPMKDQFDKDVKDLAVMPDIGDLTMRQIEQIDEADWYYVEIWQDDNKEFTNYLMVTCDSLPGVTNEEPCWVSPKERKVSEDLGGELIQVTHLSKIMHRYSAEDGFYHA